MLDKFVPSDNRNLLVRLVSENFRSQFPRYAVAVLAMVVVAAMTSSSAWIMRDIVNASVVSKDAEKVFAVATAVAVIFAVKGLATYIQSIFLSRAGNSIVASIQNRIFDQVLRQDLTFHTRYPSSELLMRITTNAQAARSVLDTIVTSFVRDLLSLLGLVAVMIIQQPLLSAVASIIGPCAILGVRMLTKQVRKLMERELASFAMIIRNVQETTTGIKVIKAFGLEAYMRGNMNRFVRDVETQANSIARLEAASSPIMETLSGFAIAAVLALSAVWVLEEGNSPGELMSFITALLLAYEPAKRLARMRVSLESGMIGTRMMYDLIDHPLKLQEADAAVDLPARCGEIKFESVTFGYGNGTQLFDRLDLVFPAGKTTALVGPSGGGKSTIINLIMRLYDPDTGRITIDGKDLRSVSFRSLRQHLAYVGQDTFLFTGTIHHNIALGREGASDADIIDAAKAANAHEFITELPNGYNTHVGENGINLSGGQRQRIAIARAMLRNAHMLILDEATSALDSEAEAEVQEALSRLTKGRTTIVIAHRLSTVVSADNILIIEQGRLTEQGRFGELIQRDGLFKRLYELQLLPQEDAVA